jgi:hypothetical protein
MARSVGIFAVLHFQLLFRVMQTVQRNFMPSSRFVLRSLEIPYLCKTAVTSLMSLYTARENAALLTALY